LADISELGYNAANDAYINGFLQFSRADMLAGLQLMRTDKWVSNPT
jgi:hypothetical protein